VDDCVFCRIIARQVPADVIAESDDTIIFLSLENHPLVVPRAHVPNLYALDESLGASLMRWTVRVARAMKVGLACEGVYVAQANEAAGGQDVFHLHIHVIPRWHGDPPVWQFRRVNDPDARERRRAAIAAALATDEQGGNLPHGTTI
jgi:histidine triad (HIT) family protein